MKMPMVFHKLVDRLNAATALDDRLSCYSELNRVLASSAGTKPAEMLPSFIAAVLEDLRGCTDTSLKCEALHSLYFLAADLSENGASSFVESIVESVCSIVSSNKEQASLSCRALDVLLAVPVPDHKVVYITSIIASILQSPDLPTLTCKAYSVFSRLLAEKHVQMVALRAMWIPWVLSGVIHPSLDVRRVVVESLQVVVPYILEDCEPVVPLLVHGVSSELLEGLSALFHAGEELHTVKVWEFLVTSLGQVLHSGTRLVNSLLKVIEVAFKSSDRKTRIEACFAWRRLISNFALNPDTISNQKRLKLLLQPLRGANLRHPDGTWVWVGTWWHLICSLGDRLAHIFDQVCVPLLHQCFPSLDPPPRKRTSLVEDSIAKSYLSIGQQVVARLLELPASMGPRSPKHVPRMSLSSLRVPLPCSTFVQHANLLLRAAAEALRLEEELPRYILRNVVSRLASLSDVQLEERAAAASRFVHFCKDVVRCDASLALCFLDDASQLPKRILNCRRMSDAKHQETPAQALLGLLLHDRIVPHAAKQDRLLCIFRRLLDDGPKGEAWAMDFAQSTLDLLGGDAVLGCEAKLIAGLWTSLANYLVDVFTELTEGDASECSTSRVLAFPLEHLLTDRTNAATLREVVKIWGRLFQALPCRQDACDQICACVLMMLTDKHLQNLVFLENLSQFLLVALDAIAVSTLPLAGRASNNLGNEPRPLGKLVAVVAKLTHALASAIEKHEEDHSVTDKAKASEAVLLTSIVEMYTRLFRHAKAPPLVGTLLHGCLPALACLFRLSAQKPRLAAFGVQVMCKLEGLLSSLATCLQLHYSGPYTPEVLDALSPLLEATLLHPRHGIRHKVRELWFSTVWTHYRAAELPVPLRAVLKKVRPSLGIGGSSPEEEGSPQEAKKGVKQKPKTFGKRLESMDSQEFVRIEPVPKQLVLTDYQREQRSKRSFIPALYSSLSQDTQQEEPLPEVVTLSSSSSSETTAVCYLEDQKEVDTGAMPDDVVPDDVLPSYPQQTLFDGGGSAEEPLPSKAVDVKEGGTAVVLLCKLMDEEIKMFTQHGTGVKRKREEEEEEEEEEETDEQVQAQVKQILDELCLAVEGLVEKDTEGMQQQGNVEDRGVQGGCLLVPHLAELCRKVLSENRILVPPSEQDGCRRRELVSSLQGAKKRKPSSPKMSPVRQLRSRPIFRNKKGTTKEDEGEKAPSLPASPLSRSQRILHLSLRQKRHAMEDASPPPKWIKPEFSTHGISKRAGSPRKSSPKGRRSVSFAEPLVRDASPRRGSKERPARSILRTRVILSETTSTDSNAEVLPKDQPVLPSAGSKGALDSSSSERMHKAPAEAGTNVSDSTEEDEMETAPSTESTCIGPMPATDDVASCGQSGDDVAAAITEESSESAPNQTKEKDNTLLDPGASLPVTVASDSGTGQDGSNSATHSLMACLKNGANMLSVEELAAAVHFLSATLNKKLGDISLLPD